MWMPLQELIGTFEAASFDAYQVIHRSSLDTIHATDHVHMDPQRKVGMLIF
jgi:hypothetical protein